MALTTVKSDQIQSSVALAGSPTTTTQSASDNSTKVATTAYVETAVANLIASAPAALNTLDELAAALNDDANFSGTITTSIAAKLPLAGGTLTGDLTVPDKIIHSGDTDTFFRFAGADDIRIVAGNVEHAAFDVNTIVFNQSGANMDFRVESVGNASMLHVDASANRIGIGNNSPDSMLHIDGAHSGGPIVTIHQTAGSSSADSGLDVETSSTGTIIQRWLNSGTPVMHVRGNGNVGIGPNTPAAKLDVQGTAMAERYRLSTNSATTYWDLRRDSSSGHFVISDDGLGDVITVRQDTGDVGIGQSNPSATLDIVGGGTNTNPTLELNSSTSNGFNHAINAFNSNLTAGENHTFFVGKEGSTKNSGYIGYKWNGAGSNNNLLTFGHWANDNIMNLTADGRFGLGTETPSNQFVIKSGTNCDMEFGSESGGNFIQTYNRSTSAYGYLRFITGGNPSETMRLKADGKVGIGTDNPLGILTIKGDGDAIRVESTNAGVGGAQLDLLHHTASPADNDVPGAINFGGYYSGTNSAYSAAVRSEWKDVSAREGRLKFYTRNAGNFNTNMQVDYDGTVGVATLSDLNNTGAIKMHRHNIGAIANYTGNLHAVTHAGIDHYEFTIQGNNTYQDLFNNIYSMGFELYIQLGDAASRDHALYSVNATSPAYGVSTFTQIYYNNGGWNTGSFTLQMIGTPGDNTEYTIQAKFTSYYNSSNNATGFVQIRRLY